MRTEPKFEFRAPNDGEWYLDADDMSDPIYAGEALDTKQWVIVMPGPELIPWPGPEHEVIVITGISNSERPQYFLALRSSLGDYRDEDGHMWYKNDREYDAPFITSWEPYQPTPERREYSADELDKLPAGGCFWDEGDYVWQKIEGVWQTLHRPIDGNPLLTGTITHAYSAPPEEN